MKKDISQQCVSSVKRGYLMLLALVFGSVFLTLFSTLSGFVLLQNKTQEQLAKKSQAFTLAESGIEYYRWFLSHFPKDSTNGTGNAGLHSFSQNDAEGNSVGTVSLALSEVTSCGETTGIHISSTGTAIDGTLDTRTITARYAHPTVALYGTIVNDSAWIQSDRSLAGAFHSNGGIRMDGVSSALVTSALASWNCTTGYGCSPAQPTAAGVLGTGTNQSLWKNTQPQIDFERIQTEARNLKSAAQGSGIYYPRISTGTATSSASYWNGYHLLFNEDSTVTVRRVTGTTPLSVTPLNSRDGEIDYSTIASEVTYETKNISANCGLIYVEDNVWIEGTVSGKVTLIASNAESSGLIEPNIYIKENILYSSTNGTSGLTTIAANNVLITADAPSEISVNGIFVAAGGSFGRNLYTSGASCNTSYEPKFQLTFSGTVVSNKQTKTKWTNGCGGGDAGYLSRADSYNQLLGQNPPAFTPAISTDYKIFDWKEQ